MNRLSEICETPLSMLMCNERRRAEEKERVHTQKKDIQSTQCSKLTKCDEKH